MLVLRLFLAVYASALSVHSRQLPDIYWNSTNPMFDISNTDHVMAVDILDRVNFICPLPTRHRSVNYEYSKLYAVKRWSYERCELSSDAKLFGVCNKRHQRTSISLVFRDFTPLPGGLEFIPGKTYYFISTSNGTREDLDARRGGLCLHNHMKLKFEIRQDRNRFAGDDASTVEIAGARSVIGSSQEMEQKTTPVMYIIHTKSPNDDYRHRPDEAYQRSPYQEVKHEPDSTTASRCQSWIIFSVAVTLNVYFWRRPHL